ncbi:lysozyme family protein [Sporolactobacillus putidus]|uniref:CwlT-like lysozyme domain-containing protein n=1 Tax=Sporolactobacillus putidus TaxID=492735 RepID=A0A917RZ34_9BACL|nr:lysozyme family protein [Sporolactobacillus putidus]GGL46021.1 hypothetical protein GCM10007968_07620 [Sporolactobacillus putidus]
MKKFFTLLFSLLSVIGISYFVLFIISSMYSPQADHVPLLNDNRVISPAIENYRPIFQKYAEANGIGQYTDLLMALAMQESKGRSPDIMQASESQGLPRNSINSPETSIKAGTSYFKRAMERSGGNVRLALQSYNFGIGFTDYVRQHGGKFTPTLAMKFSEWKAKELGWGRYGDPFYVDHVMRYYNNEKQKQALTKKN